MITERPPSFASAAHKLPRTNRGQHDHQKETEKDPSQKVGDDAPAFL